MFYYKINQAIQVMLEQKPELIFLNAKLSSSKAIEISDCYSYPGVRALFMWTSCSLIFRPSKVCIFNSTSSLHWCFSCILSRFYSIGVYSNYTFSSLLRHQYLFCTCKRREGSQYISSAFLSTQGS